MAGVSLNAIVGDNGIITNAMSAKQKQGMAALEEFLQEKYLSVYDKDENNSNMTKVEVLQKYYKTYFYMPKDYGIGNLSYVINGDGKALYILKKSGLPKEIQEVMVGGSDEGKTYTDFQELNDVYGVTTDLKVYYSGGKGSEIYALTDVELDNDNLERKVFDSSSQNGYYGTLSNYDVDGNGELSVDELKSVKNLVIDENSNISSLSELFNLVTLEKLTISNKNLSNLEGIENCPNLYYVYFKNTTIM